MLTRELERLENLLDPWREFDRINSDLFEMMSPARCEFPPVNMWKNDEKAMVTVEIPGVEPEGVEIEVTGDTLTFRFERKPEELKEGETYTRKERWYGQFSRSIELPFNVQADKVVAKFSKGILYMELPRAEAEKPKKISVKVE
ncbi:MAG: Hsp20/alpha crystallin family protein [Nitrospirae bacterium]|nr:Hsp20/alpha crystallin family protein [Nitrospirota bacterium]